MDTDHQQECQQVKVDQQTCTNNGHPDVLLSKGKEYNIVTDTLYPIDSSNKKDKENDQENGIVQDQGDDHEASGSEMMLSDQGPDSPVSQPRFESMCRVDADKVMASEHEKKNATVSGKMGMDTEACENPNVNNALTAHFEDNMSVDEDITFAPPTEQLQIQEQEAPPLQQQRHQQQQVDMESQSPSLRELQTSKINVYNLPFVDLNHGGVLSDSDDSVSLLTADKEDSEQSFDTQERDKVKVNRQQVLGEKKATSWRAQKQPKVESTSTLARSFQLSGQKRKRSPAAPPVKTRSSAIVLADDSDGSSVEEPNDPDIIPRKVLRIKDQKNNAILGRLQMQIMSGSKTPTGKRILSSSGKLSNAIPPFVVSASRASVNQSVIVPASFEIHPTSKCISFMDRTSSSLLKLGDNPAISHNCDTPSRANGNRYFSVVGERGETFVAELAETPSSQFLKWIKEQKTVLPLSETEIQTLVSYHFTRQKPKAKIVTQMKAPEAEKTLTPKQFAKSTLTKAEPASFYARAPCSPRATRSRSKLETKPRSTPPVFASPPKSPLRPLRPVPRRRIRVSAMIDLDPSADLPRPSELLFAYPFNGHGSVGVHTDDKDRLAPGIFLNDNLIDFYLKFLWQELNEPLKSRVHMYSSFFYKTMTDKGRGSSSGDKEKDMYSRVHRWTSKINVFDKDYLIVPVNESLHWYLAIICFPSAALDAAKRREATENVAGDADTRKKEEGSDSDDPGCIRKTRSKKKRVVDLEELDPENLPTIILFDSLGGKHKTAIYNNLKSYLVHEAQAKLDRKIEASDFKSVYADAPQQPNFCDCGIFLLHYVESFLTPDPLGVYRKIQKGTSLRKWFDISETVEKRKAMQSMIDGLAKQYVTFLEQRAKGEHAEGKVNNGENEDSDSDLLEIVGELDEKEKEKAEDKKAAVAILATDVETVPTAVTAETTGVDNSVSAEQKQIDESSNAEIETKTTPSVADVVETAMVSVSASEVKEVIVEQEKKEAVESQADLPLVDHVNENLSEQSIEIYPSISSDISADNDVCVAPSSPEMFQRHKRVMHPVQASLFMSGKDEKKHDSAVLDDADVHISLSIPVKPLENTVEELAQVMSPTSNMKVTPKLRNRPLSSLQQSHPRMYPVDSISSDIARLRGEKNYRSKPASCEQLAMITAYDRDDAVMDIDKED